MTRWAAFAGITVATLSFLLLLARASQSLVTGSATLGRREARWLDDLPDGAGHLDASEAPAPTESAPDSSGLPADPSETPADSSRSALDTTAETEETATTPALYANVALSHGLFALLLLGGVWLTEVPPSALGISGAPLSTGLPAVGVGLALGGALAGANALASRLADALAADPSEELRTMLAPETRREWVLLLVVVLPVIAGFEELLFRGALVGGVAAGFGVSPWLLAILSSVAFAAGHGAQGGLGVLVTGLLGFALAAAFVLTDSLLVVVLAHYVVNAVEFVGWEWNGARATSRR